MNSTSEPSSNRLRVKENILAIVWWGLALGLVIGCVMNSISGFDWVHFYYPRARDFAPQRVINPMWMYLVLSPIAVLPIRPAFAVFSLLNVTMLWLTSRLSGANKFALLISFPTLWIIWYGQLDIFVALGAALGLWSVRRRQGAWLGAALLLLLVKPHIGAPLAVVYFLWSRDWRALVSAGLIFLASLLIWGADWPLMWIRDLIATARPPETLTFTTVDQQTNISLYPYGLLVWPIVLLPMTRLERAAAIISATFLSTPYAPTYSLIVLLVLPVPWWVYVVSSAPLVMGPAGYQVTILAPVSYLVWIAVRYLPPYLREWMKKRGMGMAR